MKLEPRKSLHAESSPVKEISRHRAAKRAAKPLIQKTKRVHGKSHETTKASQMTQKGGKGTLLSRSTRGRGKTSTPSSDPQSETDTFHCIICAGLSSGHQWKTGFSGDWVQNGHTKYVLHMKVGFSRVTNVCKIDLVYEN